MTPDVLTFGETMVAVRCPGPLPHTGTATLGVAGSETNVAVGLRRLGHRVRWVSRLGDDPMGELVIRTLRAERIDVEHVRLEADGETGLIFTDTTAFGRHRVTYRRRGSAASALDADDMASALRAGARIVHVSGITAALSASCLDTVATTLRAAFDAGWTTSLDVNYRADLWSRPEAASALRPVLPWVRVLVASEAELPIVADGASEGHKVASLTAARWVAIKRGARGASLYADGSALHASALPVREVNPLGAGDAFTAGLLSGLLDETSPRDALARACAVGAAAAASPGDWEGLPTRADLAGLPAPGDTLEVQR